MAGIVFPNVANALLPLIAMDRQAEESRLNRERQGRMDQLMMEDRAESRKLREMQVLQGLDDKKRAQLRDAAEATTQAALGVLNAPEPERPAAYQTALQFLKERGHDTSKLPPAYSPGMDGMLRFYIQKAESATEFLKRQGETPQPMGPIGGTDAPGPMQWRAAIKGNESGGRYDAVGPDTGKGRAYGAYQVMDFNIPTWTAEVLGKPMTPQEFLADQKAQDAVFDAKFGGYVKQYGSPQAAARAWFAGPGGMNNAGAKDVLGTTVANYEQRFNRGLPQSPGFTPTNMPAQSIPGGLPQVAQGDAVAGQGDVMAPPRATAPPIGPLDPVTDNLDALKSGGWLRAGKNGVQMKGPTGGYLYINPQTGRTIEYKPRDPQAPPAGYRPSPDGNLEGIPGGPADPALTQSKREQEAAKAAQEAKKASTEQANKLRDDFRSEPVVKAYRVVVPMLESARDAASRPTRAADINLVYATAKLMDPESVVRESETGMVVATGTVADRLAGIIGQLNGNATLQPETRKNLIAELQSRFNALEASYNEIESAYGEIADANGIKRSHVILPIRKPKTEAAPTQSALPSEADIDAELLRRSQQKKP